MNELKNTAKELLKAAHVNLIIGYGQKKIQAVDGSEIIRVEPVFLTKETDTDQLVWNRQCVYNLVTYLTKKEYKEAGKVGIVVKPCDLKAINVLSQENQIDRKQLVIIGLSCNGIFSENLKDKLGITKSHLANKCLSCLESYEGGIATCRLDDVDHIIKSLPEGERPSIPKDTTITLEKFEKMSREERWAFWQKQFQKCLRCYACRSICPLCYCEQCICEMSQPQWIDKSSHLKGNFLFHLMRAFHLSGRCIGCSECERACPMGLPLMLLNQKMIKEVKDLYEYESGKDPEQAPVLSQFRVDDDESFIK